MPIFPQCWPENLKSDFRIDSIVEQYDVIDKDGSHRSEVKKMSNMCSRHSVCFNVLDVSTSFQQVNFILIE